MWKARRVLQPRTARGMLLAAVAAISLTGAECAERPAGYHNVFEEGGLYTGCNYWASNAGLYMWRRWEPETVKKDIELLAASGVNMTISLGASMNSTVPDTAISDGSRISSVRVMDFMYSRSLMPLALPTRVAAAVWMP